MNLPRQHLGLLQSLTRDERVGRQFALSGMSADCVRRPLTVNSQILFASRA